MQIPYFGSVDTKNTYNKVIFVLGDYINLILYWHNNCSKSQAEVISDYLNNIESIIQKRVFGTIEQRANNDSVFFNELLDSRFRTNVINIVQPMEYTFKILFNKLKVKDIFFSPKDGEIAFHVYFDSKKPDLIEIVFDLSLSCKYCNVKSRSEFLSVDSYQSFTFIELNHLFDEGEFNKLRLSVEWAESISGRKSERFRVYLSEIDRYRATHHKGLIGDEAWHVSRAFMELSGLCDVYTYFENETDNDIKEHISFITKGVVFKYPDSDIKNDKCRTFLFELKVASDYIKSNDTVSINDRADVIVNKKIYIECKKVSSRKKFVTRLAEAVKQLEKESKEGAVYIDASDLLEVNKGPLLINDKFMDIPDKNGNVKTDDRVRGDLIKIAETACSKFLSEFKTQIYEKLNNYLLVVHFDFSCLHFSPLHERSANLTIRYVISNTSNAKIKDLVESSFN